MSNLQITTSTVTIEMGRLDGAIQAMRRAQSAGLFRKGALKFVLDSNLKKLESEQASFLQARKEIIKEHAKRVDGSMLFRSPDGDDLVQQEGQLVFLSGDKEGEPYVTKEDENPIQKAANVQYVFEDEEAFNEVDSQLQEQEVEINVRQVPEELLWDDQMIATDALTEVDFGPFDWMFTPAREPEMAD